jgi:hypothetical protein
MGNYNCRASGDTETIFGGRILSFGSCAAFALKSFFAVAKYLDFGATLE